MAKKFTALLLVFALSFCFLASCNKDKSEDIYKATVVVSFSSSDEAFADAIKGFGSSTYTLYASGSDLKIESSASMEGITVNRTYTVLDNMLYNTTDVTAGELTATEREKAQFTKIDRNELIVAVGAGAVLDANDFGKATLVDENKKQKTETYVYSEISADSADSVRSIFAKRFEALNANVELEDAQYYVEYKDDAVTSYILNASFVITMNGVSYNVNMSVECTYDYDAKFEIGLPEGADGYQVVRYDDIIG